MVAGIAFMVVAIALALPGLVVLTFEFSTPFLPCPGCSGKRCAADPGGVQGNANARPLPGCAQARGAHRT